MGVHGRIWRVIKNMYESSRNVVLLEEEKLDSFNPLVVKGALLRQVHYCDTRISRSAGKGALTRLKSHCSFTLLQ